MKLDELLDISNHEYHNSDGWSRSQLMELRKTPLHFWYKFLNPNYEAPASPDVVKPIHALEFGNALHHYILEKDSFESAYKVIPKVSLATKAGKAAREIALRELQPGQQLLCESAFEVIQAINNSISADTYCPKLLQESAQYEKSMYWKDEETGLIVKCRPDILHDDYVADLKTTSSAAPRDFQRDITKYGYHIQAAMIKEGLKHVTGKDMESFYFICAEKVEPYATAIYKLDENALDVGYQEYRYLLDMLATKLKTSEWSSYKPSLASIPAWYEIEVTTDE